MLPSAAELVARYLKANGYTETLRAFIKEAELAPDAGSASSSGVTVEQILHEKGRFDLSSSFEKLGVDDEAKGWQLPAPSKPTVVDTPTISNILSTHSMNLALRGSNESKPYIGTTTADRRLDLFDVTASSLNVVHSYTDMFDSPVLDLIVLDSNHFLVASMSGKLMLYDTSTDTILEERRDHSKYVVKITKWSEGTTHYIATAGWDSKVFLYRFHTTDHNELKIGKPIATLSIPSVPETVLLIQAPGFTLPVMLLARRDSSFLYYYALPTPGSDESELSLLGKQNLAPHSTAWVAFTPCDVQLCPTDSSIAAVATSSIPHMKLLILRLLIPPKQDSTPGFLSNNQEATQGPCETNITQASQARAALAIQDREEAAILVSTSTFSPQTPYSTPKLVWRHDGSGIYLNADDGVIRGFEARTGKLIATLEGHEPGSKIRCLWTGKVPKPDANGTATTAECEEVLVSGGFDQKLIVWRTAS